jgi:hypothetical protein
MYCDPSPANRQYHNLLASVAKACGDPVTYLRLTAFVKSLHFEQLVLSGGYGPIATAMARSAHSTLSRLNPKGSSKQ